MRKSVIRQLVAVSLVLVILLAYGTAGIAAAESFRIRTLERGVSLRTNPWVESNNKILGIHADTTLEAYGEINGWYYVYYNGYWGYVAARDETGRALVSILPSGYGSGGNYGNEVQFSQVDYSSIQIRTSKYGASLRSDPWVDDHNKIGSIHANTTLDVYGEIDGWYYVFYNGDWGYVASRGTNGNALVTVIPKRR
ncbi:MAG: SH3 domain-containing protein [Clostridia bacterium]|nr:SH3 domain-containing protein [Clostridia bacterium]